MTTEMPISGASPGSVLDGRYRIDRLLGEGGMGGVYAATDLRLEKPVAVKVMARELAANPDALARFHREARVTSGLGHPHIVQVFDFSATPSGEPFLVMELLEGEDLDRRLRRLGRLPAASVVHIVKQVASALAATHAKAIVHRDLKPGNIFLLEAAGEIDFVKVLDFGISKMRTATTKLTRTSSVMGTPNYMSPEQARGRVEEIDERTDQWALACIAWECLSGEGPFVGENVPSILFQIVHEAPPSLLPRVAGLPPQVEGALLRGLAKDKSQRFPNVSELANALEAALAGEAQAPGTHERGATTEVGSPRRAPASATTFTHTTGELDGQLDKAQPRSRKWVWLAAVGAAALVALASFLWLRPAPGPAPKPVLTSPRPAAAPPAAAREAMAPPSALPPPAPAAEPSPAEPKARGGSAAPVAPSRSKRAKRAAAARAVRSPSLPTVPPPSPRRKETDDKWRVD